MNSSDHARSLFITGLRNAHGMENQALSIMQPQVNRIEHYPDVAERLNRHIEETKGQMQRLETVLQELNEDHSSLKDIALSIAGSMAALGHTVAGDEILKNSFANFAFENYEIAAYKSLITLAEAAGFSGAVAPLQANLREEQAMASWLDENLSKVTMQYAALQAKV